MYQALYRKWRPQTFDDVIGQKHITDSLKNQVMSGRLSHAYIFIGTRGTGKTTCARILAKAVNCEHPVNGNPCGQCASCKGISDGSIMDIVELDAASNNGVDNVRALRDEATFSPADVKKRVYIIDEVHMLSTSAFNALLKIIEEPPEHLMFILATTELQKVPATILSRCQRHSFRRIDRNELGAYLRHVAAEEEIDLTEDAADLIAGLAEGGVRDALSMLDQCSAAGRVDTEQVYTAVGLAGNRRLLELFGSIRSHDTEGAVRLFDILWKDGKDPATLLKELSNLLRDILIVKVAPKAADGLIYGGYDRRSLQDFASSMTQEELTCALDTLQTALGNISLRAGPKMTAELALVSLCQNLSGDSVSSLRSRISVLEEAVRTGAFSGGGMPLAAQYASTGSVNQTTEPQPASPGPRYTASGSQPAALPAQPDPQPWQVSSFQPLTPEIPEDDTAHSAPAVIQNQAEQNTADVSVPVPSGSSAVDSSVNPAPASVPVPNPELWQKISAYAKELLPIGLRSWLNERGRITARFQDSTLFIETDAGFFLTQLNRPEIISKFEAAASAVTGSSLKVRVRERQPDLPMAPGTGDLEELRKFPEVKFV